LTLLIGDDPLFTGSAFPRLFLSNRLGYAWQQVGLAPGSVTSHPYPVYPSHDAFLNIMREKCTQLLFVEAICFLVENEDILNRGSHSS